MAYTLVLFLHSWLRWIILVLGIATLARSVVGWRGARAFSSADDKRSLALVSAVDLQMLLGLVMYFLLSPVTAAFREHPAASMKDPTLRFFSVEHQVGMLLGIVVLHVARARGKRKEGVARHRLTAWTTLVWLVLTLGSVPWPGMIYGRALFRTP